MKLRILRICSIAVGLLWLLTALINARLLAASPATPLDPVFGGTIPPVPPVLQNADFECTEGYYSQLDPQGQTIYSPEQWRITTLDGAPMVHSARIFYAKSCDGSAHVERINGIDSVVIRAEDLETPPNPGKPFDITLHQQVTATVGGEYSLSGWMLSLCGGSAVPSDCPQGNYIAKMLGIDPTGGTDPTAETVIWTENRRNFVEEGKRVGWQNLRVSARALQPTITIFARVRSPFQWHGNHAFIDALSLVRAPTSSLLLSPTVTGTNTIVLWNGLQSADVAAIPGGTYELLFDVRVRHELNPTWSTLTSGQPLTGSTVFSAKCLDTNYLFSVRARAEQPEGSNGAWPNQRYEGVWSSPVTVRFVSPPPAAAPPLITPTLPLSGTPAFQLFLPVVAHQKEC